MKDNSMQIADYQALIAIAEEKGFRAAAHRLNSSPSKLSRQISRIEENLGVRLFDRDTRKVNPTHQGKTLIELAYRFLNSVEKTETDFKKYLQKGRGRLTITGLPSITSGLLPHLLNEFTKQYSDIDVQIHDGLSNQIINALESGEADIGFSAGTETTRSQLSFRKLVNDPFVAISKPDGFLSEERSYKWSEITDLPYIAMTKGTSVRELVDSVCSLTNTSLTIRYEVSHLATAGALIAQGLGVGVLPRLTLPSLSRDPLVTRSISDISISRDIGIVWPSGTTLSPSALAFLELATELSPRLFSKILT
jgi:LysR family transcriptional regulator, carnitine catabolism transcriptional activator